MSWTLHASGHCNTEEDENSLIEQLRKAVRVGNPYTATLSTQYSGTIDLLSEVTDPEI